MVAQYVGISVHRFQVQRSGLRTKKALKPRSALDPIKNDLTRLPQKIAVTKNQPFKPVDFDPVPRIVCAKIRYLTKYGFDCLDP